MSGVEVRKGGPPRPPWPFHRVFCELTPARLHDFVPGNTHTHLPEGLYCVGGTTVQGLNPFQAEALLRVARSVEAGWPAADEPLPLS